MRRPKRFVAANVFFGPGPRTSLHGRSGIGLRRLAGAKGSRRGMVGVELVAPAMRNPQFW